LAVRIGPTKQGNHPKQGSHRAAFGAARRSPHRESLTIASIDIDIDIAIRHPVQLKPGALHD